MGNEDTREWFQDIETVVAEPRFFKAKLGIGEDAYASLRLRKFVGEAWGTLGTAGAAAILAQSSMVASALFVPTGWLAVIGIGAAVTPIGWVIAAGVATGGTWFGVGRYLKSTSTSRTTVIPDFINTPLDVLAIGLFDLMAPLALKIADIDGEIHKKERAVIESYFIKQWGYDVDFVREGLAYSEANLSKFSIEVLARELAEFKKGNPDCNFKVMTTEVLQFLTEVIESDNRIDDREQAAIDNIEQIIKDVAELAIQKTARSGWNYITETVSKTVSKVTPADNAAAVSDVIDSFRAAGRAGDLDAFMANFADDAVLMLDDRIHDANKMEIREYFSFLNDYTFDQEVSKDEIMISGEWAFARVTFDGFLVPKPGVEDEPSRVVSRHFMTFNRGPDGIWKLARDMWILPSE
jgi:ketosteroid isomerase-like protein